MTLQCCKLSRPLLHNAALALVKVLHQVTDYLLLYVEVVGDVLH